MNTVTHPDAETSIIATFALRDEAATTRLGSALADTLRQGDIIALEGALGMGKTALARGLVRRLCGCDTVVASPTFTLVQVYDTPDFPLWHCDLYRIESDEDAFEIGLGEAFTEAATLIEWPERLESLLPPHHLRLIFIREEADGSRIAELRGDPDWSRRLKGISLDERS